MSEYRGQWVTFQGSNSSATTLNGIYTNTHTVPTIQGCYQITPVAWPPPPRTEVERLLGEVEAVCALAR